MKSLFILFVAVIAVIAIKEEHKPKKMELVRIDVRRTLIVNKPFMLYIPRSIKFGDPVVNAKVEGIITLHVQGRTFCYIRPIDFTRNEYLLSPKCGAMNKGLDVVTGDKIEFKFSKSNMWQAQNVPMFGEEAIDV
jgi:hypothetical protein